MYLFLGQSTVVRQEDTIGIFDMDNTTVQKSTREFLNSAEKSNSVITVSYDLPKTFVVCNKKGSSKSKIYITPISPSTLFKRLT